MMRFSGIELHAVLAEAGIHGCRVVLVKDHGVYLMAERGESHPDGRRKRVAYAQGCNPELDDFETWWQRGRDEFGGDDFAEYFEIDDPVLASLRGTAGSLVIEATPTHCTWRRKYRWRGTANPPVLTSLRHRPPLLGSRWSSSPNHARWSESSTALPSLALAGRLAQPSIETVVDPPRCCLYTVTNRIIVDASSTVRRPCANSGRTAFSRRRHTMSTAERASPPVVLSAGVWHHLIQTEIISASVTGSPRLSALLRTALALTGQRTFRGPIILDLGACLPHHAVRPQTARQVQISRITRVGEPAFLLIRLPHETHLDA